MDKKHFYFYTDAIKALDFMDEIEQNVDCKFEKNRIVMSVVTLRRVIEVLQPQPVVCSNL